MRNVLISLALASLATPAMAKSDLSVASSFAKAVRKGNNLDVAFPGVVNSTDAAALRGVAGCNSESPNRQAKGKYFIIFDCGRKGAIVAEILVTDGRLTSVSTSGAVKVDDGIAR